MIASKLRDFWMFSCSRRMKFKRNFCHLSISFVRLEPFSINFIKSSLHEYFIASESSRQRNLSRWAYSILHAPLQEEVIRKLSRSERISRKELNRKWDQKTTSRTSQVVFTLDKTSDTNKIAHIAFPFFFVSFSSLSGGGDIKVC